MFLALVGRNKEILRFYPKLEIDIFGRVAEVRSVQVQ